MKPQSACCYIGVLGAVTAMLFTAAHARAQGLYQLDWGARFNTNAGGENEDNWVANSYVALPGRTHLVSISLPIGESFSNQPISALIYTGSDLHDPTAGNGLVLVSQTDTTFTSTPGTIVTITLTSPVDMNLGDIFYAAVLIPNVGPGDQVFPFYEDTGTGSGIGGLLQTQPLGRSFFDAGPTLGAPYDVTQGSANVTVLGGNHPVLGAGIQGSGNLALWVLGTPAP
jgi:hypothetical protein